MINVVVQNRIGGASTNATIEDALRVSGDNAVNISLNLGPSDVVSFRAQGNDLVMNLANGQIVTIVDFYDVDGPVKNRLFLSEDGELVQAALPQSAETAALEGLVTDVAITDANVPLVFNGNTELAAVGFGGLGVGAPSGALIAGAGLGLLTFAAIAGGGGSDDSGTDGDNDNRDTDAPNAPELISVSSSLITGRGEPGALITISVGEREYTTTVDVGGNWTVVPAADDNFDDGEEITVTATDESGNESDPTSDTIDLTPPNIPVLTIVGVIAVEGITEPGASVTVTVGGEDYTTTADENGVFSVAPIAPDTFDDGDEVVVTAIDQDGNESEPANGSIDGTAPTQPVVTVANAEQVTGSAEPGVIITAVIGGVTYTTTANDDGNWAIEPQTPDTFADAETLAVTATDQNGNESDPANGVIDALNPAEPTIAVANATEITGVAEPNTTITVTVGGENFVTVADADGNWSVSPEAPATFDDGDDISVISTDGDGNDSNPTTGEIDATAPSVPSIDLANGTLVNGTADPGTEITVVIGGETYTTLADVDGNWRVTPNAPDTFEDAEAVAVTSTDGNNNISEAATDTIDDTAPSAPVIEIHSPSEISGTAEPNSVVNVTIGGLDYTRNTDNDGNWTIEADDADVDVVAFDEGEVVTASVTDSENNISPTTTEIIDGTAPDAPIVTAAFTNLVNGYAEPGSIITFSNADGDVSPVFPPAPTQIVANSSGQWIVRLPLTEGEEFTVVATDRAGNDSAPETVNMSGGILIQNNGFSDTAGEGGDDADPAEWTVNEADPRDVQVLSGGAVRFNSGERAPAGGSLEQTVTGVDIGVGVSFSFNYREDIGSSPSGDAAVLAEVIDSDGNVVFSQTVTEPGVVNARFTAEDDTFTVRFTDATTGSGVNLDPLIDNVIFRSDGGSDIDPPIIETVDGTTISGTGVAGTTITVLIDGGNAQTVAVGDDGTWSVTSPVPLDEQTITATATDLGDNESAEAVFELDDIAPNPPIVGIATADEISGFAEPGSTVAVTDGNQEFTAIADGNGDWSFDPDPGYAPGTELTVTATDAAGNVSDAEVVNSTQNLVTNGTFTGGNDTTPVNPAGWIVTEETTGPDANEQVWNVGDRLHFNRGGSPAGGIIEQTVNVEEGVPVNFSVDYSQTSADTAASDTKVLVEILDSDGNVVFEQIATTPGETIETDFVSEDTEYTIRLTDQSTGDISGRDAIIDNVVFTSQGGSDIAPPVVTALASDEISGTGQPGATISVDVDSNGSEDGTAVVGTDGTWSVTLAAPIADTQTVSITQTDQANNESAPAVIGAAETTSSFVFTGDDQFFDIPDDATSITVQAWGAAGSGRNGGGGGGFSEGTFDVADLPDQLLIVTGGGGEAANVDAQASGGYGGGGDGGTVDSGSLLTGGGGGGLSGIFDATTSTSFATVLQSDALLIAGGGGGVIYGGGVAAGFSDADGSGANGEDAGAGGGGGTQTAGGAAGTGALASNNTNGGSRAGEAGFALQGGDGANGFNSHSSGGGGGGYFGGGGGGIRGSLGNGDDLETSGGGGAGFVSADATGVIQLTGDDSNGVNTDDPNYVAGVGVHLNFNGTGDNVADDPGGNGLVIITVNAPRSGITTPGPQEEQQSASAFEILPESEMIDFDALGDGTLTSIDLSEGEADTVLIGLEDVLSITDDSNTLLIFGDSEDTVVLTDFLPTGGTVTENGVTFDEFSGGVSTLLIEEDVTSSVV